MKALLISAVALLSILATSPVFARSIYDNRYYHPEIFSGQHRHAHHRRHHRRIAYDRWYGYQAMPMQYGFAPVYEDEFSARGFFDAADRSRY
jgi:hypothetical protein